ncbi:MAG TPA: GTP-binding protein, partial [Flavobacteriales bacterium]|nr:GTP-binding protein [Flavobacteriales bacterium]
MGDIKKTMRLSKIAGELNIGISTIIDFLTQEGHKIDKSPNTKISEDLHDLLLKEFQSDILVKEDSKLLNLEQVEKETITIDRGDKYKDSETLTEPKDEDEGEKPAEEEKIVAKVDKGVEIKVVGKIDVEDTKSSKKKEEKKGEDKKSKDSKADDKAKDEKSKKDDKDAAKSSEADGEIIAAKLDKIEGPKVVGNIKLPPKPAKAQDKKLVASSSESVKLKKKKRKRIIVDSDKDKGESIPGGLTRGKTSKTGGRAEPSAEEIKKQIKETLSRLSDSSKSKSVKYRKQKREAASEAREMELKLEAEGKKTITVTEFVSANELSSMIDVPINDIISSCMELGLFVSINQRLDAETLSIVADEFGYEVNFVSAEVQQEIKEDEDNPEDLVERPPVVTVMGHVDHGKTSLLDSIRKTNVIVGEAGGITQHIGAYEVTLENGKQIAFLDTPGHEAFTAMRARGAQITDVVIIIVAADDNIMPQTIEAINHASAAGVPMVFAINKIDKSGANVDKIKEELSKMNYLVEDWGGKYQSQDISAK